MSEGSCPNGGNWYTCTDQTAFFGCCTSDPCNSSGCPSSDLRAAGMGSGSGPDSSSNDGSYYQNEQCTLGQWWTCADQTPSFQGCCLTNPCQGDNTGCPDGELFPAAFASVTAAATSSTASSSSTSKSHTTSKTTQTSSSATSSSTTSSSSSSSTALPGNLTSSATSSNTASSSHSLSKTQVHAIAGGAAAGAVCIFLLFALCITWYRAKKSRKAHISQPPLRPAPSPCPPSPFPPEMTQFQSTHPNPRTPLPYLQTDLSKTTPRQRTYSTYSAYSPDHITPSSFDSQYSAKENLVGNGKQVRHSTDEAYYPGRPIFGVPHAIKSPEAVAQPGNGRRSRGADTQGPSPPPAYVSHPQSPISPIAGAGSRSQHSPTSPTAGTSSRRASNNYSYPMRDGGAETGAGIAPTAAVGARSSQRRSVGQQYDSRKPTIRQVQSDRGLGGHEPRRRSEPAPPIYENPDQVPELPDSPTHDDQRYDPRRPVGKLGLRVRTMSGSAIDGNALWGTGSGETVESVNAGEWGGDMRTDRERERDFLRERERQREMERQRVARMRYTNWQT